MEPQAIADELIVAQRERKAIPAFTDTYPFLDVETAYRAQWLGVEHRMAAGNRLIGAKLGLTSRVKREAIAPVSMGPEGVVSAEFDGLGSIEVYC